jgi:hypothetical protein
MTIPHGYEPTAWHPIGDPTTCPHASTHPARPDYNGRPGIECDTCGLTMRPKACKPGRHAYRRVALAPVVHSDGSATLPYHEACARCGKVKRGSFDF